MSLSTNHDSQSNLRAFVVYKVPMHLHFEVKLMYAVEKQMVTVTVIL